MKRILGPAFLILILISSAAWSSETDSFTAQTNWQANDQQAVLRLELPEQTWVAHLKPTRTRGPSYRVWVQGADLALTEVEVPAGQTWIGQLAHRPDSQVLAYKSNNLLRGTVTLPGQETINLNFSQGVDGLCTFTTAESRGMVEGSCGLDAQPDAFDRSENQASADKDLDLAVRLCTIACDTDVGYYTACGSTLEGTLADIELVIAGVSGIYQRDGRLSFEIGEVVVRTTEFSPYATTNPNSLLQNFSDEWRNNMNHIERDVVHLFTGQDLDGTALGIAWDAEGVCNSYYGYSLVQSHFSTDLNERVAISTHELGHNFDLNHCDYLDWWCRIMCASIGGCSAGINSFGTESTNRLLEEIDDMECLGETIVTVASTSLPFSDDFNDSGEPDPTKWTAVDQAKNIYGRLELESGDTYGVNELGTLRTLPMSLNGAATIRFKARSYSLVAGQPMRVEVFDSTNWQWILLGSIISTGGASNPFVEYEFTTPAEAVGDYFSLRLSADGNYGDSNDEWHIDDLSIEAQSSPVPEDVPSGTALVRSISPNPFNPSTTITVMLRQEAHLEAVVYDLNGHIVARICDERRSEGQQNLVWNGQGSDGRLVGSGSYLLKVSAAGIQESKKLLLLK